MYILRFINDPQAVALLLFSIIVAVTFHEFAHAWASDKLGDPTARLLGRKSLNPARHLDPWGSVLFLVVGFGWGKPVPVDSFNLRDEQKDNALIALAGPASNILLAAVAGVVNQFTGNVFDAHTSYLVLQFAYINVSLAVFNLLPIPPLDGSRLYRAILPSAFLPVWRFLDQYGVLILMVMILSGANIFSFILQPAVLTVLRLLGF